MELKGLTTEQAKKYLAEQGPNELPSNKSKNLLQLIWNVIREPMLLLLFAAGLISFFLAELADAIFLSATIVIITFVSIYQVRKSSNAIASLREMISPLANVIRDGVTIRISSKELVNGDLMRLREGDRILADAQIISGSNLHVDESMLTGESISVAKGVDSLVYSGTLVVKGHGVALVQATGANTQIGEIGRLLLDTGSIRTNLQSQIDKLVKYVAIVSLIAALTVILLYGVLRDNWLEASLAGIAAAMALLPEEFPVVLTVFFAIGGWRLSQVHVITRHTPAIELLGTITVLCVDKTGTITTNQMTLEGASEEVAYYGLLACPQHPFDPMDKAFAAVGTVDSSFKLVKEYPLTESRLAMAQVWQTDANELVVAAKGSPEAIAKLCGFDPNQINQLHLDLDKWAQQGYRMLGVARAKLDGGNLSVSLDEIKFDFVGIAKLRDPVRSGVTKSVLELNQAGVRTIMLTGDYSGTASQIGTEIGLLNPQLVMTGSEISELTDQELSEKLKEVNVFARVAPQQKLRLVNALRANGEVVAMTGDGVNDAPALSSADIGIAMGLRGTDVAREAADFVISDDDFNSIAVGIRHGRRIYANLRKAMAYIIAIHIPIFGMALLPVFTPYWPLVLLPAQIALLEIIIDPAASIVFESEKSDADAMRKQPRPISEKLLTSMILVPAIFRGLLLLISSLVVYFWALQNDYSDEVTRSLTFATIMLGNILAVLSIRSDNQMIFALKTFGQNASIKWLLLGALLSISLVFNWSLLLDAFNLAKLNFAQWVAVMVAAGSSILWFEINKLLVSYRSKRK